MRCASCFCLKYLVLILISHLVVDEVLVTPGHTSLPAPAPGAGVKPRTALKNVHFMLSYLMLSLFYLKDVEAVAGAGLGHLPLQQPLVAGVKP